jgi:hypothetical protein
VHTLYSSLTAVCMSVPRDTPLPSNGRLYNISVVLTFQSTPAWRQVQILPP